MYVIKNHIHWLVLLYVNTLQNINCGLLERMESAMMSMQEMKEKISQKEEIIVNQSQVIKVQNTVIFASNQTQTIGEHSAKLEHLQTNVTGKGNTHFY